MIIITYSYDQNKLKNKNEKYIYKSIKGVSDVMVSKSFFQYNDFDSLKIEKSLVYNNLLFEEPVDSVFKYFTYDDLKNLVQEVKVNGLTDTVYLKAIEKYTNNGSDSIICKLTKKIAFDKSNDTTFILETYINEKIASSVKYVNVRDTIYKQSFNYLGDKLKSSYSLDSNNDTLSFRNYIYGANDKVLRVEGFYKGVADNFTEFYQNGRIIKTIRFNTFKNKIDTIRYDYNNAYQLKAKYW